MLNKTIILKSIDSFHNWRKAINGSVGLVPTLGGLHDGHVSLIKKSISLCDYTVVSLFLNPLQFNKNEDLSTYPCNLNDDLKKIKLLNISILFIPKYSEMLSSKASIFVDDRRILNCIEGKRRPMFFSGVLTVVSKLFNITNPTDAFFGKKDPQQLFIIKKLCTDLNYNINIISCSTIREKNGLAMSTRNNYLTSEERKKASVIYESLLIAQIMIKNNIVSIKKIRLNMENIILSYSKIKIDYISFSNSKNLKEFNKTISGDVLVSVAVFIGNARLIDSFFFPDYK